MLQGSGFVTTNTLKSQNVYLELDRRKRWKHQEKYFAGKNLSTTSYTTVTSWDIFIHFLFLRETLRWELKPISGHFLVFLRGKKLFYGLIISMVFNNIKFLFFSTKGFAYFCWGCLLCSMIQWNLIFCRLPFLLFNK